MLRGVWGFGGSPQPEGEGQVALMPGRMTYCRRPSEFSRIRGQEWNQHVFACMRMCTSGMGAGGSATEAASAETHRVLRDGGLLISITESSWELHGIMGPHGFSWVSII